MIALDLLARVGLAPLLAWQAVSVRRTARRLPEPEGPRQGNAGHGPPLSILIIGDSSAAGVGVARQDQALSGRLVARLATDHSVTWTLRAASGATTSATLRALSAAPAGQADIVVVALGVNDVTRAVPLPLWLARQRRLAALIGAQCGARHILVTAVPPMGRFPLLPQPLRWVLGRQAARFDRHLARLAAGVPGVSHVRPDFGDGPGMVADDGFHPGPQAYDDWAALLARMIRAALAGGA